jgi:hypothetical protein
MRVTKARLAARFGIVSVVLMLGVALPGVAVAQQDAGVPGYEYDGCHTGCADPEIGSVNRPARVLTTVGGRYEHVVIGPAGEAGAVQAAIEAAGGRVVRTSDLPRLGQRSQIATFPGTAAFEAAQAEIARLAPGSSLSLHDLYGFAQAARSPRVYAPMLIGDAGPGRCRLAAPMAIGMIDGPVNTDHPALQGADITYETLIDSSLVPSADHGTAVAALLVGEDDTGVLAGYARGARLHAISVFATRDQLEQAPVEAIAIAIDRLVAQGVRLINMSIAGPENAALARALTAAAEQGVVLVAASGNNRRERVSWPAAAPEVIAVTAIDAARRRFRLANTGVEVEFSAPGVDVYAANDRGAGYVSGTSFATPIVTALAARSMSRGAQSADAIRARLRDGVETLGPGQRNTEYGWGLVKARGC